MPYPTRPLDQRVIDLAVSLLPHALLLALKSYGPGAVIGGGFLRTAGSQVLGPPQTAETRAKDIDVFVPNKASMLSFALRLYPHCPLVTDTSITVGPCARDEIPIQVIGEWKFKSPVELLKLFDFSVVQAVLWWNGVSWEGRCGYNWASEILTRTTTYSLGAPNPAGSLLRLKRMTQLGYDFGPEVVAQIAVSAVEEARRAQDRHLPIDWMAKLETINMLSSLCRNVVSPERFWDSPRYAGK